MVAKIVAKKIGVGIDTLQGHKMGILAICRTDFSLFTI